MFLKDFHNLGSLRPQQTEPKICSVKQMVSDCYAGLMYFKPYQYNSVLEFNIFVHIAVVETNTFNINHRLQLFERLGVYSTPNKELYES
jgi:hypothetical protein